MSVVIKFKTEDGGENDFVTFTTELDNTIAMAKIASYFPGAVALRYRDQETNFWRT